MSKYYSYLVIYVDDVLCIDINTNIAIDKSGELFRIKDGSIETPTRYL